MWQGPNGLEKMNNESGCWCEGGEGAVRVEGDSGMSGRTPREKEGQQIQRVQPTAPKKVPAFTALVDFSSVQAAAIHDGRAAFSSSYGRWDLLSSIRNTVCVAQLEN